MRIKEIRYFQDLLLRQRTDLLNRVSNPESSPIDERGDECDIANKESTLSLGFRLQERNGLLLQKVDHALARIENGTFGSCELCEEPLSVDRLKARPFATLCIACKEEQESSERLFA